MASVWFPVLMLVLTSISQVIAARDCSEIERIKNCDECIRCGAIWCNDPNEPIRCSLGTDEWCLDHQEPMEYHESTKSSPEVIKMGHNVDSYVKIGDQKRLNFEFPSDVMDAKPKIKVAILNSTVQKDTKHFQVAIENVKYNQIEKKFTSTLVGKPSTEFCSELSTKEYITMKVEVEGQEGFATVRYAVPCSCGCSANADKKSELKCKKRGDYACGACKCEKGWKGDSCEIKDSPNNLPHCDRGDISGCVNRYTEILCSNNGICACDGKCNCFKDLEGSQYFDDFCDDICSTTSYCDACLRNPTIGPCQDCHFPLNMEPFNKTFLDKKDLSGRNVWYNCTEKTDSCNIQYAAMKDGEGVAHVMIIDSCQPIADQYASGIKVTIPVTLGVIAIVAAMAAVAGYMVYKNRTPPLPLTDPQYQNIDAEDCTGENPLYKPPTSSFKNPTYGKW